MSVKAAVERITAGDADALHTQHAQIAAAFRDVMHEMAALEEHMAGRSPGSMLYIRIIQLQLATLRMTERIAELQLITHGG